MTTEPPPRLTRLQRWKSFRFRDWVRELLSPGDSAHELAWGTSVGVFVGFTPLFGLHLALLLLVAFALQRLVRFNKALAIAASDANNPVTFAPLLWASDQVGAWLIPSTVGATELSPLPHELDWHGGLRALPQFLYNIGWPMLVGCLVLGVVMAAAVYPVTYGFVTWSRRGRTVPHPAALIESVSSVEAAVLPALDLNCSPRHTAG